MTTYELRNKKGTLKTRVTAHDDAYSEWDFSMDEFDGFWMDEGERAIIVKMIRHLELYAPHESGFYTEKWLIQRISSCGERDAGQD